MKGAALIALLKILPRRVGFPKAVPPSLIAGAKYDLLAEASALLSAHLYIINSKQNAAILFKPYSWPN